MKLSLALYFSYFSFFTFSSAELSTEKINNKTTNLIKSSKYDNSGNFGNVNSDKLENLEVYENKKDCEDNETEAPEYYDEEDFEDLDEEEECEDADDETDPLTPTEDTNDYDAGNRSKKTAKLGKLKKVGGKLGGKKVKAIVDKKADKFWSKWDKLAPKIDQIGYKVGEINKKLGNKMNKFQKINKKVGKVAKKISLKNAKKVDVALPNGDNIVGLSKKGIESFRGIPFAEPPLGDLRFKPSVPYNGSLDGFKAFEFGYACRSINPLNIFDLVQPITDITGGFTPSLLDAVEIADNDEDCLTINIWRPEGTKPGDKLKVLVWVYGGAFIFGSSNLYPGDKYIQESVELGEPIIFVSYNYRLGPYGYLGGEAIQSENSSNAALYDSINAFKWIKENIAAFGGDPEHITAMGESAGAMTISALMISSAYKNDPFFDAVILQSGGVLPAGPVADFHPTNLFWKFSEAAGCGSEGDQTKALACLRASDSEVLYDAATYDKNISNFFDVYGQFTGWAPRQDGVLWDGNPFALVAQGELPDIPIIIGSQEDEGTLISFFFASPEDYTDEKLAGLFPNSNGTVEEYLAFYTNDLAEGAPFRTGEKNELWPGFKRQSALLTDILFTGSRRMMLYHTESNSSPRWSYFANPLHNVLPYLGSTHANCLLYQFYGPKKLYPSRAYRGYYLSFVNHYDPNTNNGGLINWPEYHIDEKLAVLIGANEGGLIVDNYREGPNNLMIFQGDRFETD